MQATFKKLGATLEKLRATFEKLHATFESCAQLLKSAGSAKHATFEKFHATLKKYSVKVTRAFFFTFDADGTSYARAACRFAARNTPKLKKSWSPLWQILHTLIVPL